MVTGKEQFRSSKLLQQVQELGLLNSDWAIKCTNCQAIFPGEYRICPKCNAENFFQEIQVDFEI